MLLIFHFQETFKAQVNFRFKSSNAILIAITVKAANFY